MLRSRLRDSKNHALDYFKETVDFLTATYYLHSRMIHIMQRGK